MLIHAIEVIWWENGGKTWELHVDVQFGKLYVKQLLLEGDLTFLDLSDLFEYQASRPA